MHPVEPWLVILVAFAQLVVGVGIGFKAGVDYVHRKLVEDMATQRQGKSDV